MTRAMRSGSAATAVRTPIRRPVTHSPATEPAAEAAAPQRARMAQLLEALATREGVHPTAVPGVELARQSQGSRRSPVIYEPMILFIGAGRKRAYLGDEVLRYDAERYLALSVPVPAECEVQASPDEPLLALKIAVEPAMLADILIDLDEPVASAAPAPRGIHASPISAPIQGAVIRLLECLQSPRDSRILGRQIVREIVYRVLHDEPGGALRALAARNDQFMRVARVMQHIHTECAKPLRTHSLARLAGMSVSTFHHTFKAVTATSPLQYVKSVRLHRARMLMTHEGHTASTAAAAVGYVSPSQFGREFKRFFGATPAAEAATMRARLGGGAVD